MSSALPSVPVSTTAASPPRARMYADTNPRFTRSQVTPSPVAGGRCVGRGGRSGGRRGRGSAGLAPDAGGGCRAGRARRTRTRGRTTSDPDDRERERATAEFGEEESSRYRFEQGHRWSMVRDPRPRAVFSERPPTARRPRGRRRAGRARRPDTQREVRDQPALELRAGQAVHQPRGAHRRPEVASGLDADRRLPEPAAAREHREPPALGLHDRREGRPIARRSPSERASGPRTIATVSSPSSTSTDSSRAAQGSGRPGQRSQQVLRRRHRCRRRGGRARSAAAPSRRRPGRTRSSRPSGRRRGGSSTTSVRAGSAEPGARRPWPARRRPARVGVAYGRSGRRRTPDEPRQEVVAQRLVMTVQLAVRGDHDERWRLLGERLLVEPRHQAIAHERSPRRRSPPARRTRPRTADRRRAPPRSTGRRPGRPGPGAACRPPPPSTPSDLPRRQDGVADAVVGQRAAAWPCPRPSPAATCRSGDGRSGPRSRACPSGPRSAGRPRTPAAGSRGGRAGPCRSRHGRRRRSRGRRPGRRPAASPRAWARGPRTSLRGCPARRWAGSSRR